MAPQEGCDPDRGRESTRPRQIPWPGWRDILLRTKDEAMQEDLGLVVAGVAFYALLALFPAIAALVSVYGLVSQPEQVQQQFAAVSAFMPEGAQSILADQMTKVARGNSGALSLAAGLSLLVALWSASRGTKAFMTAMNVAYREDEDRGLVRLNLTALALTLFLILLAVLAIGCVVVAPVLLALLAPGPAIDWIVTVVRWPVIGVVLVFGLAVLYRFAPSRRRAKWRWVTPGSFVAVLLWLVASIAFSSMSATSATTTKPTARSAPWWRR